MIGDEAADPPPSSTASPHGEIGSGEIWSEEIPRALAGERLDRVVSLVTGVSRAVASELVATGAVAINGAPVSGRVHRVAEGDRLRVALPAAGLAGLEPDPSVPVPVVHADDAVIVVDKPAGLVVHPGTGHGERTLVHGLLARFPELAEVGEADRPGIVHRLDRDTSGLMVVARTPDAYVALVEQLRSRTVERRYDTLAWGEMETRSGVVDAPIGRSPRQATKMAVVTSGRPARTRYEERARWRQPAPLVRLACRLETGRTHQIRVHLAAIGHPVVGDLVYGGARQSLPSPRQWLHAEHLGFVHPRTGEVVAFDARLPDDLRQVLEALGPPL